MQLTESECKALASHPATVIKALIDVVSTIPDLDQLVLAIANHPQTAALAHAYDHRHRELRAAAAERVRQGFAPTPDEVWGYRLDGHYSIVPCDEAAARRRVADEDLDVRVFRKVDGDWVPVDAGELTAELRAEVGS